MSQALPLVTRQGDRIAIVSGLRTHEVELAHSFATLLFKTVK